MGKGDRKKGSPRGGKRASRERGAYGNARGKTDKQAAAARRRAESPRTKAAKAEAEALAKKLPKMGGKGPAEGAKYAGLTKRILDAYRTDTPPTHMEVTDRTAVKPVKHSLPMEGSGNGVWGLGQARSMLRQGYNIAHVVERTGWGLKWFNDLPIDSDGYGESTDEWIAHLNDRPGSKDLST